MGGSDGGRAVTKAICAAITKDYARMGFAAFDAFEDDQTEAWNVSMETGTVGAEAKLAHPCSSWVGDSGDCSLMKRGGGISSHFHLLDWASPVLTAGPPEGSVPSQDTS